MPVEEEIEGSEEISSSEKAAAKIQAGYRGYRVRKRLQEETNLLQRSAESEPEKPTNLDTNDQMEETSNNALEEKSATKIQAGVRGYLVRKRQQAEQAAATRIQAGFRGFRTRKLLKLNEQ